MTQAKAETPTGWERCVMCGEPADAENDDGDPICAECLWEETPGTDEADPDAAARIHVEQGSSKR